LLQVGIRKRRFPRNAGDRCLEIPTVKTKGQLSSNGHRDIRRGLHSKDSLALTSEEEVLGRPPLKMVLVV
jgi:hypothetical protein